MGLLSASAAAGLVAGVIPASDTGTLIPGHANATSMTFAQWHLLGLAIGAPVGVVICLLAPVVARSVARGGAGRGRLRVRLQWVGIVLASGLATVPIVVLVNNPPGLLLTAPGALLSVWVIRRLQGNRRIPLMAAAAAFGWGATAAVTLGLLLSLVHRELAFGQVDAFTAVDPIRATLPAPVWEEFGKGVGVLVVFHHLRDRFDGVIGGIIVGAMVGAGFNFCETVRYALTSFDVAAYQVWTRQWVAGVFAGHVVFTALTGLAVGVAVSRRRWVARIVIVLCGYCLAALGHLVWNVTVGLDALPFASDDSLTELGVSMPLNYVTVTGPFIGFVFGSLWVAQRRESSALRTVLPVEAASERGAVRPAEVPVLLSPLLRVAYRIRCLRTGGPTSYVAARRLQLAQIDLGVERWRVARAPSRRSQEDPIRLRIEQLRERLHPSRGVPA